MFADLVKIIETSGVSIVISCVMIILFYRQYIKMENINKQYINYLCNVAKEKTDHNKGIQNRLDVADKVNAALKELVLKSGAIRGYIFELHNSSNNLTGLPFVKFSMTYEYFIDGERPAIHDYQNLSLSTLSQVIYKLYNDSFLVTATTDTDTEYFRHVKWFLNARNAQAVIFVPLKDIDGKISGIIGFDFADPEKAKKYNLDEMEKVFFHECGRISGYLDYITYIHS